MRPSTSTATGSTPHSGCRPRTSRRQSCPRWWDPWAARTCSCPCRTAGGWTPAGRTRTGCAQVLADAGAQGCYVYCLRPASSAATAYARFFNPTVGISEDPATGSAAGPLAAHLVRAGKATGRVAVEQGHAQGRPSTLVIEVADDGSVSLLGRCVLSAQGTLAV